MRACGEGLDYFVLTFKTDSDRWIAAWRLREQGAQIEVRNAGANPERFELHVWMPISPVARPSLEQIAIASKKKKRRAEVCTQNPCEA
jgi:hypothetical protein